MELRKEFCNFYITLLLDAVVVSWENNQIEEGGIEDG